MRKWGQLRWEVTDNRERDEMRSDFVMNGKWPRNEKEMMNERDYFV